MSERGSSSTSGVDRSEGDINLTPGRARWQRESLDDRTRELLARDEAVFIRQALSTPCLNALAAAHGCALQDAQGRQLLDFHGNSVHQVGHGHPRVVAAIKQQLDELPFCPRRYTNLPAIELAERLCSLIPGGAKALFAPSGTGAIGIALKLARAATGRFKTLSLWDSFHGASLDAISIGGEAMFRRDAGPLLPGCEHAPAPNPHDCLWGCAGSCSLRCAGYIEHVLSREPDIGAVIAEPIRCTTVTIPPPGYWQRVRAACDRHGALLIFDEIPICLGRTGRMFAFEHEGVRPDILVIGKGLGGGIFPMAAVLASAELDIAPDRALGHYTHEKSPVGAAAALATLDVIRDEQLIERSERLGHAALERLRRNLGSHAMIASVRGRGLLLGIELRREAGPELADRLMYDCLARGLSFKVSDGCVLTLTPPLTITEAELDRALGIVESAIACALDGGAIAGSRA